MAFTRAAAKRKAAEEAGIHPSPPKRLKKIGPKKIKKVKKPAAKPKAKTTTTKPAASTVVTRRTAARAAAATAEHANKQALDDLPEYPDTPKHITVGYDFVTEAHDVASPRDAAPVARDSTTRARGIATDARVGFVNSSAVSEVTKALAARAVAAMTPLRTPARAGFSWVYKTPLNSLSGPTTPTSSPLDRSILSGDGVAALGAASVPPKRKLSIADEGSARSLKKIKSVAAVTITTTTVTPTPIASGVVSSTDKSPAKEEAESPFPIIYSITTPGRVLDLPSEHSSDWYKSFDEGSPVTIINTSNPQQSPAKDEEASSPLPVIYSANTPDRILDLPSEHTSDWYKSYDEDAPSIFVNDYPSPRKNPAAAVNPQTPIAESSKVTDKTQSVTKTPAKAQSATKTPTSSKLNQSISHGIKGGKWCSPMDICHDDDKKYHILSTTVPRARSISPDKISGDGNKENVDTPAFVRSRSLSPKKNWSLSKPYLRKQPSNPNFSNQTLTKTFSPSAKRSAAKSFKDETKDSIKEPTKKSRFS